jgi:hypothetical protein
MLAGVNLAREEAYRQMLARGFRSMIQGVTMHLSGESKQSRLPSFSFAVVRSRRRRVLAAIARRLPSRRRVASPGMLRATRDQWAELRGRLAGALGDASAADRVLRQALDLYREIGATGHAERLGSEIGA